MTSNEETLVETPSGDADLHGNELRIGIHDDPKTPPSAFPVREEGAHKAADDYFRDEDSD